MRQARHERRQKARPRERCGVQVEAAEHHPRPVRQRDDELAQAAIGPADRRRLVEDRGRAAQQREREDRPAAAHREVDADRERAGERGDADPEHRHRRSAAGRRD